MPDEHDDGSGLNAWGDSDDGDLFSNDEHDDEPGAEETRSMPSTSKLHTSKTVATNNSSSVRKPATKSKSIEVSIP